MSNLRTFAEHELNLMGYTDGDEMNTTMRDSIIELIDVFSKQGHSGFSASYCLNVFNELARFKCIAPITGNDDEWFEYADGKFQNNRCHGLFKDSKNAPAYYVDAVVWVDETGSGWTNSESKRFIKSFPFTPKTFYVKRNEKTDEVDEVALKEANDCYGNNKGEIL